MWIAGTQCCREGRQESTFSLPSTLESAEPKSSHFDAFVRISKMVSLTSMAGSTSLWPYVEARWFKGGTMSRHTAPRLHPRKPSSWHYVSRTCKSKFQKTKKKSQRIRRRSLSLRRTYRHTCNPFDPGRQKQFTTMECAKLWLDNKAHAVRSHCCDTLEPLRSIKRTGR